MSDVAAPPEAGAVPSDAGGNPAEGRQPVPAPFRQPVDDVTVVVPFKRGGNETWLRQATGGFPVGQKLVVVENDGEMAEALNDAITNHVQTDWVYRFDADDVALPGLLHLLRDAVWDGTDVAYPTMLLSFENADGDLVPVGVHHADPFCPKRLEIANYISGASLFRRERFVEVGGYRDLLALEDWDLWLRMLQVGAKFKAKPDAFFHYRQVGGSRNKISPKLGAKLDREIRGDNPAGDCVATFYYSGTPYTAHLRCVNPAKHLPAVAQPMHYIPSSQHEEQPAVRFPHQRGKTAVFQFGSTQMDSLVQRWMQLNGVGVFIEVDDNYTRLVGSTSKKAGWQSKVLEVDHKSGLVNPSKQKPSVEGHLRMVRAADGVICATEYLAKAYREHNENVWVCPNQVQPDEWPDPPFKPNDDVFRIGWFAAGPHHVDFPLVAKALRWASKQPGVQVVLMGLEPPRDLDCVVLPFHDDWNVYRVALGQLDVGIAPITPTPFALGRSDLKALDYAMGGAAPILQDCEPYEEWAAGETCLKAKTPDDWLRCVKHLVYNRPRAKEIAAAARAYTLGERTFEKNVGKWTEAFASVERTAIAA